MNSETDDRIDQIVNGLAQVLKTSITHQETAENAVYRLDNISKSLLQKIQALEGQIREEIKSSVRVEINNSIGTSSETVFRDLLGKFGAAEAQVDQAVSAFQDAAEKCQETLSWSIWKVCVLACGISALVSLIGSVLVVNILKQPPLANSSTMNLLSANQIIECSDGRKKRLCAKVDEEKKPTKSGYRYVLMKTK